MHLTSHRNPHERMTTCLEQYPLRTTHQEIIGMIGGKYHPKGLPTLANDITVGALSGCL